MTRYAKSICLVLTALPLLLLLGCASGPSVTGQWKAIDVPRDYMDRGVQSITIDIREDNTFTVNMYSEQNDALNGFGGAWAYTDKNKIEFEMLEPPYQKGTGELLPDGRLKTIGGEYTIYNEKVSQ